MAVVLIVPCVVFSHDKHLRRPGIAPPDLNPVVGASIASSEAELVMAGAATATAVTGTALSSALGSAARALGVPRLATWSVLAVAVALGLSDEKRRRKISASLKPLGTGLLELLSASETAKAVLAEAAVAAPLLPPLECRIADVLVRASGPLLVREIRGELAARESTHLEPEQEIRALLRALPCFAELTPHRWELGRKMAPQGERKLA